MGKTRNKFSMTRVQNVLFLQKKDKKGVRDKLKMAFGDKQKELELTDSSSKGFIKRGWNSVSADSFTWI